MKIIRTWCLSGSFSKEESKDVADFLVTHYNTNNQLSFIKVEDLWTLVLYRNKTKVDDSKLEQLVIKRMYAK